MSAGESSMRRERPQTHESPGPGLSGASRADPPGLPLGTDSLKATKVGTGGHGSSRRTSLDVLRINVAHHSLIPLRHPQHGTMCRMARWTAADIPDQSGRVAVVTGANSGLGYITSRELARTGARVVLACRDEVRGKEAIARLIAEVPAADVELRSLDMASLASIRAFADATQAAYPALDLLINNAGVMAIARRETADGFEMQFGTNHLGHFALTGLLLPLLVHQPDARVVTVSSNAHKPGRLDFEDLMHAHSYRRWKVYADSKLANLLFTYELQRRLAAIDSPLISVAAHPGTAATNLVKPGAEGNRLKQTVMTVGVRIIGQSEAQGALPQLYAATAADVHGGEYFGPNGIAENRGYPKRVDSSSASKDAATAARLWTVSEDLTGVGYEALLA
jgi:NAD(P)-dependent dehydrogenase (short-subunit alcohol dehydrogenase family)